MALDIETIGYFLYMDEQEKQIGGDPDEAQYTDQEQEEKEGLYNG